MKYSRQAFGSVLEIDIAGNAKNDLGISESFFEVEDFEKKYSRFIDGNLLSEINLGEKIKISPEITSLLHLCNKVSKLSGGYFDITLLPVLENAGYGISSEKLEENTGYKNIVLSQDSITLLNGVKLELGSIGKGYMLDVIYNILSRNHSEFVVNFGGDMRISGEKTILLENPYDATEHIGCISLENLSIASSSGNKRQFGGGHHLRNGLDTSTQNDKIAVYVTHKLGVFADVFATALFVTPLEHAKKMLEQIDGLEALMIIQDGKIFKTPGFTAILNTKKGI